MTTFPLSPRLIKGGIVLIDPGSAAVLRMIALQYNPDTLTRTLQVQATEGGQQDRSEAMRLKGPPTETLKVDAEIDATDQLEFPDQNPNSVSAGIHPQLAALEMIVYPSSSHLQSNNTLAQSGTLEIVPMRITDFSITEEAFDTHLNPIRAKVSLGMRVLSINDLGFQHKGGSLYMLYQQNKERFAALARGAGAEVLGIGGVL